MTSSKKLAKQISGSAFAGALSFSLIGGVTAGEYQVQPIKTTYARTSSAITVDGWFESMRGMELDEVEDYDGWTAGIDLLVPFLDRFQLRLSLPMRTEGSAVVKESHRRHAGESIDIEGYGGLFDFAKLTFEHQLVDESTHGYNFSYYVGGGTVLNPLDTTLLRPNGIDNDKINHRGRVFLGGVKYDRQQSWSRILGNAGIRYYASDDLSPSSDQFVALDLKAAAVFSPWRGRIYPVLEFVYLGDFKDLNQVALIPEVVVPLNRHLELKAGANVGLGGNGSEFGGLAEITAHF